VGNASGITYDDVDSIPHNRYGLLLATSPITPGGARNFYFDNRIKAADDPKMFLDLIFWREDSV